MSNEFIIVFTLMTLIVVLVMLRLQARRGGKVSRDHRSALPHGEASAPRMGIATEGWDRQQEVQQLIEQTPELRKLYGRLGYAPEVVRKSEQLLKDLKALIRAEIPDFGALQMALRHAQRQVEQDPGRYQSENDDLLHAILAAGDEQRTVLELLNRNPVEDALPFVEQLPFYRDGKVVWRAPSELLVIRKRPADPVRFAELLDETEKLFKAYQTPQNQQVCQEVLDAITRVRRDLQRANAYIPPSFQSLERKVRECVHQEPSAAVQAMRKRLDELLGTLVDIRHTSVFDSYRPRKVDGSALASCKDMAHLQARIYLDTRWMHTPWLTTYILTTLLDSELAALLQEDQGERFSAARTLELIRGEVASGHYDRDETIRRLRQQEERGLYVSSLVYPLLRLTGAPSAMTR